MSLALAGFSFFSLLLIELGRGSEEARKLTEERRPRENLKKRVCLGPDCNRIFLTTPRKTNVQ
jgi:hypothetical protein